jgi:hypothetical protein
MIFQGAALSDKSNKQRQQTKATDKSNRQKAKGIEVWQAKNKKRLQFKIETRNKIETESKKENENFILYQLSTFFL